MPWLLLIFQILTKQSNRFHYLKIGVIMLRHLLNSQMCMLIRLITILVASCKAHFLPFVYGPFLLRKDLPTYYHVKQLRIINFKWCTVHYFAEELACENKRLKGIGIGAPEGPLSLDDFRSLQRSNRVSYFQLMSLVIAQTIKFFCTVNNPENWCMQELRRQLEDQVLTIDTLRNENRATVERHENVCSSDGSWLFFSLWIMSMFGLIELV